MEAPRGQALVVLFLLSWSLPHGVWSENIFTDLIGFNLKKFIRLTFLVSDLFKFNVKDA